VKIVQVTIVLLLLGMMGCRRPHSSDLPGTWMMSEGSRKVLPAALQNAAAKIVLIGTDPSLLRICQDYSLSQDIAMPEWSPVVAPGYSLRTTVKTKCNLISEK